MSTSISVFGAGAFGTALAQAFARGRQSVRLWARSPEHVQEMASTRRNARYSGTMELHPLINPCSSLEEAFEASRVWVYACPSSHFRKFLQESLKPQGQKGLLVNTAKGLDPTRQGFFHETVEEVMGSAFLKNSYFALSGPSFAKEIFQDQITCVTLAGQDPLGLKSLQHQLSQGRFRVYTSTDLVGVQLGGSMKNVLAIASGILAGMGVGVNTQCAFINLGLSEMARLGRALGARVETFFGFSGMGDLVLTCSSPLSRNRSFGELIGRGLSPEAAARQLGSTLEGAKAAPVLYQLIQKHQVIAPLSVAVARVLNGERTLGEAFDELLSQPPREEWI